MKLYEYQAKELFAEAGIPVPKSRRIGCAEEVSGAVEAVGLPCVLKSQVLSGGRGKAGLIKVVKSLEEARDAAADLFGRTTPKVPSILVEEAVDIDQELYLSVTVDPATACGLVMACAEGGVEIETLAKEKPEAIVRRSFDIARGLEGWQARQVAFSLGLSGEQFKGFVKILLALTSLFQKNDGELAEINPLFITRGGGRSVDPSGSAKASNGGASASETGSLIAGDGKFSVDDNSLHRQKRFEAGSDHYESEVEKEAAEEGIPFLQFDGDISLMCAGAGLTTTVYDLIHYEGGTVANYLEFGGPNYRKAMRAMELCLKTDSRVILIVTFGTIARADVMAEGVVDAISRLKPDRPIVTCIRGTNEEGAVKILSEAGLEPLFDTEESVRKAVAIAAGDSGAPGASGTTSASGENASGEKKA
jgi:succinyl-CoA synthetase beta subunit